MPAKSSVSGILILLFVTVIWGASYIPLKIAMDQIDPMLFSSIRFFLGALILFPFTFFRWFRQDGIQSKRSDFFTYRMQKAGIITGFFLSLRVGLQQLGIVYTEISNAGFITSLYLILVPLFFMLSGRKVSPSIYLAGIFALVGIYFLSFDKAFNIQKGDLIVLISSVFWALHIIVVERYVTHLEALTFACCQFFYCAVFNLGFSIGMGEAFSYEAIRTVYGEILWGGFISVGIGYTLQVFGQKRVSGELSALIFSIEAVFATLFAALLLNSIPSWRGLFGCSLILCAILYTQKDGIIKIFQKRD